MSLVVAVGVSVFSDPPTAGELDTVSAGYAVDNPSCIVFVDGSFDSDVTRVLFVAGVVFSVNSPETPV